ncbi:MAG: hypothetical protein J0M26_27460 [Planctomycetes bacterium]|nr:hypothetical protein [Planctomycetota bacterium]
MEGSALSGVKYADDLALDARRGIYPKDYDVAVVSSKILQRAEQLGLNALNGPHTAKQISALGLAEARDILSKASKGGIPVNFKIYRSVDDVYDYAKTIPFAPWRNP